MADFGWGRINQGVDRGMAMGIQLGAIKQRVNQFNEAKRMHNAQLGQKFLEQASALRKIKTVDAKRQAVTYQKMALKIMGPDLGLTKEDMEGLNSIDYNDTVEKYSEEMDQIFQGVQKGTIDQPTALKLFAGVKSRFMGELDVEGNLNAVKAAGTQKAHKASAEAVSRSLGTGHTEGSFNVSPMTVSPGDVEAMQSTEAGRTRLSQVGGIQTDLEKEKGKTKQPTGKQQDFEFLKTKFPDKGDDEIAEMAGMGVKHQKYASKIWNLMDEQKRASEIYGEDSEVVKGITREVDLAKKEGVKYVPAGKTPDGYDVWRKEGQKGYLVAGPNGEDLAYEGPMTQTREREAKDKPTTWDKMRASAVKALKDEKGKENPTETDIAKQMNEMYKGQSLLQLLLGGSSDNPMDLDIK